MEKMEGLKYMLCQELEDMSRAGKITSSTLQTMHLLTDTIKNIYKIEMMEESGGQSQRSMRGSSRDGGSYEGGDSGRHYVRGHYSREGGSMEGAYEGESNAYGGGSSRGSYGGGSSRGSYGGGSSREGGSYGGYSDMMESRYSRDEGKEQMMKQIEEMMQKAKNSGEKEALRRCLSNLERA